MSTLFDNKHRLELEEKHPIRKRSYTIPTPMIDRAYRIVRELVWSRRPGMVFYGIPQSGKSYCSEAIADWIQEEFPQTYVLWVAVQHTKKDNEKWVRKLLLSSMGHVAAVRDDPIDLLNNVVTHIRVQQSINQGDSCVLILDEMHCLNADHYFQLLDFSNVLLHHKIRLTTIGFAQPEILQIYSGFICRANRQFIARFLSDFLPFEGCASQVQLAKILRFYDDHSEYPDGSGISYTQFYLPLAFEAGLRLEQYKSLIWDELLEAGVALGGQSIPMVHVSTTVEELLLGHRSKDCVSFAFSEQDIRNAVVSSGLQRFSGMNKESEAMATEQST